MGRFAERRQARHENRQDRRSSRRGSIKSACEGSVTSSYSSKSSDSSHKSSHSSHKGSCKSSFSSSCSSNGSHTSHDSNNTFVMREKLLTFGKDFEIKEASHRRGGHGPGKAKYYVDNKVLRARETFNIRSSRHGEVLYQVQERKLRVRDTMKIEDGNGDEIAKIKKRAVGVVRDNFVVKVRGDRDWQIHGAILDLDFTVKENGKTIVKVHKNWVTPIKDCYFIDIDEDCDDKALALMVVIGLEDMSED